MDARAQRIRQIGHATRFKPGNRCSPGRPRTATFSRLCRRFTLKEWDSQAHSTVSERLVKDCLREALAGSAEHAAIIIKYAGPELWREMKEITKDCLETG